MNEMEQQLSAILSNPEMMAKVQQLAASMQSPAPPAQEASPPQSAMQIPPEMLHMAMEMMGSSRMDKRQQTLLSAMKPYMSQEKASRLQSAMEAAHLAQLARTLLGGGFPGGSNV